MNKSTSITELTKALIKFHSDVEPLTKDATNPFFKSNYTTLDNIINSIAAPLNAAGLTFAQFPSGEHGLTTILMHESGEWIESEYFMKPVKDDPQGSGSVITYQRRYALASILGLSVDTDDDGNAASVTAPVKAKIDNNLPWLNKGTKEFDAAVKKLKLGQTTVAKIKSVMKVSREVEALLNDSIKTDIHEYSTN